MRVRGRGRDFTSTTQVPSALIPHDVRALVRVRGKVRVRVRDKVSVEVRVGVNAGVGPARAARLRVLRVARHWVGDRRWMACRKQARSAQAAFG